MNLAAGQWDLVLRVLVVEDYVDGADTTAAMIRLDGHEVKVARDGPAACTAAETWWPDVVLLDIALPGCDGYEVARRIRELTASKPRPLLVAITGYAQATGQADARAAAIDLHFAKPIDPAVLLTLLRKFAAVRFGGPYAYPPRSTSC
jgi:two-component system CheB/CheR fusion protein